MIDITSYDDTPQVFVFRSGNRFFINRSDALLIGCKDCGGVVSCILHVEPSRARLPITKECTCLSDRWTNVRDARQDIPLAVKHKEEVS
jgi:hypothetical protein